jgi:hypothetical protein
VKGKSATLRTNRRSSAASTGSRRSVSSMMTVKRIPGRSTLSLFSSNDISNFSFSKDNGARLKNFVMLPIVLSPTADNASVPVGSEAAKPPTGVARTPAYSPYLRMRFASLDLSPRRRQPLKCQQRRPSLSISSTFEARWPKKKEISAFFSPISQGSNLTM